MDKEIILNEDNIKNKIYTIRSVKVMLDSDLAELYNVETKQINRAIKRNIERFPEDFMFQLTNQEFEDLRYQFGTANWSKKRFNPYVFTEQGVSMLSAVLKSEIAIDVSVKIMRTFIAMRKYLSQNRGFLIDSDFVYRKLIEHDNKFEKVFNAIEDNTLTKKQGIFFDGQIFDAFNFVSNLIKKAKDKVILIDNFIDESILTLLSNRKENIKVTIYTRDISNKLKWALEKFNEQYEPIEIKEFNKSHDRFLIIDDDIYHFGASLKDLGKKWFAFSKFEKDAIKILDKLK